MIIWKILSIGIRLIPHCRRFSPSWIRFTAPSASHHAMNWKNGRAMRRSRDADLRGGIWLKATCAPAAAKKRSGSSNKFEGKRQCRRRSYTRPCKLGWGQSGGGATKESTKTCMKRDMKTELPTFETDTNSTQ